LLGCSREKETENEGDLGGPMLKVWNRPRGKEKKKKKKMEAGRLGLVRGKKGKWPRAAFEYRIHFSILLICLNLSPVQISNDF
jgi:hypothetical protein